MKKILIIFAALLLISSQGFAHSGRTDSNGGHNCSAKSKAKGLCTGYHYHNRLMQLHNSNKVLASINLTKSS